MTDGGNAGSGHGDRRGSGSAGSGDDGGVGEDGQARKGFRVTGRVQGVGFRWWTQKTASSLDLRGTVRNCRDGSVEIHAAGARDSVESLERRLHEGPSSARVESVEDIETKESLPGEFRIVR